MSKLYLTVLLSLSVCLVGAQTVSFKYESVSGVFCNPAEIRFHASSTSPAIGFKWDFGDGQTSNLSDPYITYNSPGTYTVRLLGVFQNSTSQTSQVITINPSVTVSLTADRSYICQPGPINFTASGSGNFNSFEWTFGDGTTTITTTPTITHNYSAYGNFVAKVKAIDVGGCYGIASYTLDVKKAPISGSASPLLGCIPALVNFSAAATLPNGDAVANYSWDFGDGSVSNTSLGNTSYTYTNTGKYKAKVTITTNEGCVSDFMFPPLAYGTPPVNLVSYATKYQWCGSEDVTLVAKAPLATSYVWDYGDGQTETKLDTITFHRYGRLGMKTITVTPLFNGCPGAAQNIQVNIVGVIASFRYQNTCTAPTRFTFTNTTEGNASSILWNFGDGSPTSTAVNQVHTFPPSGTFKVSLAVVDSITGCTDIISSDIFTATPTLFNADSFVCRNSVTVFSIQNNYSNPSATYNWNVLGVSENSNVATFPIRPVTFGNFTNNFVIIDNGPSYCPDTVFLNKPLLVKGPDLSYTSDANTCVNAPYMIKNTSTPYLASDPIIFSSWNYGFSSVSDTSMQPGIIRYPSLGDYLIKLIAKDKAGCVDSLSKFVHVFPTPFLRIFPRTLTLCQGKADTLIAYHSDSLMWSPAGSVSSTTKDTVLANPSSSTVIFGVASNTYGCSTRDSSIVTVYTPFTAVASASVSSVCLNASVTLSVTPPGKRVSWTPSSGLSDSTAYTTSATPLSTTTYVARLTDSIGCFSSQASVDVIVKSLPLVNAGPDQILPYGATFTLAPTFSDNVKTFSWSPATNLSCTDCAKPTGIAYRSETYTLKVTSDSGCVAQDAVNITIECKYANLLMPTAFTPNNDGTNDVFYPMTRGIKKITRFAVYDRAGMLMYEAKDFMPNDRTFGWNGRYRGAEQPGGAYVYLLEALCEQNESLLKKGSVILLR